MTSCVAMARLGGIDRGRTVATALRVGDKGVLQLVRQTKGVHHQPTRFVAEDPVGLGSESVEAGFPDALELFFELFFAEDGALVFQTLVIHRKALDGE